MVEAHTSLAGRVEGSDWENEDSLLSIFTVIIVLIIIISATLSGTSSLLFPFSSSSEKLYFAGKMDCFVFWLKIPSEFHRVVFSLSLLNGMFITFVSSLGRGNVNDCLLVLLLPLQALLRLNQESQRMHQCFSRHKPELWCLLSWPSWG